MKYKQIYPKLVRSTELFHKQHKRCSLCDALLKTQRYLSIGKSVHESMIINNNKTITYAECYRRYLNETFISDKLNILCLKCCEHLQRIHTLHLDADKLTKQIRQTCYKTKRMNRIRHSFSQIEKNIDIKEEPLPAELALESIHNHSQAIRHIETSNIPSTTSAFIPPQIYSNEYGCCQNYFYHHTMDNTAAVPYSQFLIESPTSTNLPHQQLQNESNHEQFSPDDDRSVSSWVNEDENGTKTTRLTRRQYDFLVKLPDQQSLNAFIEASSSESDSRWTWRRTSANSRGYKIYYVCNYSMRRHYHPCSAAMYALFNPEGTISIYSFGQHEHIPKKRLPLTITNESKTEIFKCLQSGMSTTDIREHLIHLKLPFGDTKKLNNFIKYHKELLRFGAVTNVRLNGSAYRQPQCWAIRRTSSSTTTTTL